MLKLITQMVFLLALLPGRLPAQQVAIPTDFDVQDLCDLLADDGQSFTALSLIDFCRSAEIDYDNDGFVSYGDQLEHISTLFDNSAASTSYVIYLAEIASMNPVGIDASQLETPPFSLLAIGAAAKPAHNVSVSSTYPPSHSWLLSSWFPPNHMFSITQSWPTLPPHHNTALSGGTHFVNFSQCQWPPNHSNSVSTTWGGTNPAPSHDRQLSFLWGPGHTVAISATWPPNHDMAVSRTYPPNHSLDGSRTGVPNHIESTSDGWNHIPNTSTMGNGPTHGVNLSTHWPPNHQPVLSGTWPSAHTVNGSLCWPSSHAAPLSLTWPPGFPSWPPNHTSEISSNWGGPNNPTIPVFPPGHAYSTSLVEILDIINGVKDLISIE